MSFFYYFCRTQAEMAHTCRGTINLSTAHIDTEDSCNIVLSSGGRTYHLKASSEVERQRWVTALELAKAKAIRMRDNQSGRVGAWCIHMGKVPQNSYALLQTFPSNGRMCWKSEIQKRAAHQCFWKRAAMEVLA